MSRDFLSTAMTQMTGMMLDYTAHTLRSLKEAHPDDPAAVVAGLEAWLADQIARNERRANAPVMGDFHRVIAPDGRVIRDWWPTPKPATLKAWLKGNAPKGSTTEHRTDIASEGIHSWHRGKSYGDQPDRD